MDIKRIDSYVDARFPQQALWQHGAFEADGEAVWFEIVSEDKAVVHGKCCPQLIEEFRFFAEHITVFYDENGAMLAQFPRVETFPVEISDIQPSQFYVDEEKLEAVRHFVRTERDIVVPLTQMDGRYVSLDGHTRMAAALEMGIETVQGFFTQADECLYDFAREAIRRGIRTPGDMEKLSHEEYCEKWHKSCDDFFAARKDG